MTRQRRPVIIAIVCAVLAVVVYGLGVGLGRADDRQDAEGTQSWRDRFGGLGLSAPLVPTDFIVDEGSCSLGADSIDIAGGCRLTLAIAGGRFDLGPPTRRARLVATNGAVRVAVEVERTAVARTIGQGDDVGLTYGRAGGSLTLSCALPPPCSVRLAPP